MSPAGRRRTGAGSDRGSATAELAVALPAVVLVLAACVGALQLAAVQVRLQDAAALAARAAARGDPVPGAAAGMGAPGSETADTAASITVWRDGAMLCASASTSARWGPGLPPIELVATSCSVADG